MSGIYGIINLKNNPVDPSQMNKMEELLIHRGVDGKAQWIDGHVGLGHLKLEITPESEYERLPLEYKQWVITADARIDNRDELDAHLNVLEKERPFTPDTTYIVKAYEKWGKDCVKYLIGDFAFAIWDQVKKTLFCARDHIGIKPFFYLKTEDKFVFASELKTIVELREIPVELNESKLGDWMYRIQDLHNPTDTLFMNIKRLMPAHIGIIQSGQFDIEQYWRLERKKEIKFSTDEAYAERLRDLMIQAVECRMRTKYEIGVTLSGGLDSSSVACIAARKLAKDGKSLYTASSVLPDNWDGIEEDEREYIEAVVEQEKNIIPTYVSAEGKGAFNDLNIIFNQLYLPVNAFYYMDFALDKSLKKTSDLRIKLNGFFGDIAVSHKGNLIFATLIGELKIIQFFKVLNKIVKIEGYSIFKSIFKDILIKIIPARIINIYRKYNQAKNKIYKPSKKSHTLYYKLKNTNNVFQEIAYNITGVLHYLEETENRNSQFGLNEWMPLADIRLLDYIINLPAQCLYYNGWRRGLIKFAMSDYIPEKVRLRKHKTMFSPDYFKRIADEKGFIEKELKDIVNLEYISKYIHIDCFKNRILSVIPIKNWQDPKFDSDSILYGTIFTNLLFLKFYHNYIKII